LILSASEIKNISVELAAIKKAIDKEGIRNFNAPG
jgi:hypothetical protein